MSQVREETGTLKTLLLVGLLALEALSCKQSPPTQIGFTGVNRTADLPAYAVVASPGDDWRDVELARMPRDAVGCAQNPEPLAVGQPVFVATSGLAKCGRAGLVLLWGGVPRLP